MMHTPVADLMFDTVREAARAGLRSAGTAPRQLLFRRGATHVDVLTPPAGGSPSARFLWGAVTEQGDVPCAGSGVAWIGRDGSAFARATADEFGEFRVEIPADGGGCLLVEAAAGPFECWIPPLAPEPIE